MIGAMAESATADDVEAELDEEYVDDRYVAAPAPVPLPMPEAPTTVPFSGDAARAAIDDADAIAQSQCGPPMSPDRVVVRLRFTPEGEADDVVFEPPWQDESLAACMIETFLACQVPPFDGAPVTVKKTLAASPAPLDAPEPPPATGSAAPSP